MGGFVCALPLRGSRLDRGAFGRSAGAAPYRGAPHTWLHDSAAFAAMGDSPMVVPDPAGTLGESGIDRPACVFHGVLHNRPELLGALNLSAATDDAAVVLAAYAQWKQECASRFIGEFAFILWDPAARAMYGARDVLGIRPFYYRASPSFFVAASDLLQILAFGDDPPPVNEGMVAEHLADAVTSWDETLYADVYRLPPGHWLTVTSDGSLRRHQYWRPREIVEETGRSDDDYAEEFRHLFADAVRCRLPDAPPLGLYFSGGVDSSAVAAALSAIHSGPRPLAFSLTFGEHEELDELRYIRDVAHWCGLESIVTRATDAGVRPPPRFNRDPLDWQRDLVADDWKAEIRGRGIQAVLTGRGGDDAFFGTQLHYAGMLRQGRVLATLQQWRADAVVDGSVPRMTELVTFGMWPLLPRSLRRRIAPMARLLVGQRIVPQWIQPDFARRVNLADRLRPQRPMPRSLSASRDDIIRSGYELGWKCLGREVAEREAAEHGIDERHPFLDRRIVEFALRIPDDQRWRGTLTRYVVRRALHDRLPPSLRYRSSSGSGSARVFTAARALSAVAFAPPMLAAEEAGWITPAAARSLRERVCHLSAGRATGRVTDAHALGAICASELWFREAYSGRYTATDPVGRTDET